MFGYLEEMSPKRKYDEAFLSWSSNAKVESYGKKKK